MVHRYDALEDQHFVGLICSSLAYGRVGQILASCERVLAPFGRQPYCRFLEAKDGWFEKQFGSFKHRFTTGSELVTFFVALRRFVAGRTLAQALAAFGTDDPWACHSAFVENLGLGKNSLMPQPSLGSSCKRSMLWWRWCVRRDALDLGGFDFASPSKLIVPLDTHMARFGRLVGLTKRKANDAKTAREITEGFARLCPDDPVRYDFAITRFGIHPHLCENELSLRLSAGLGGIK